MNNTQSFTTFGIRHLVGLVPASASSRRIAMPAKQLDAIQDLGTGPALAACCMKAQCGVGRRTFSSAAFLNR